MGADEGRTSLDNSGQQINKKQVSLGGGIHPLHVLN